LKKILTKIGKEMFKKNINVTNLVLWEIPMYHFLHGGCFLHGRMTSVLFFTDIEMGMAAVSTSLFRPDVVLIRFSIINMENNDEIIFFPSLKTSGIQ